MAKKKGGSAFLWVILILLILGLAGFGATSFGGGQQNVATVGDVEVDVNDYVRAVEQQTRAFSQATGQTVTFSQARAIGLDAAALGSLISRAAIENEAAELGISVGDETVAQEIAQTGRFQDGSGTFNRETYQFALREMGMNARDYEAQVRASISAGLIQASVAGGINTPDIFVDTLFNYARETRDVTWTRLTAGDLPEPIAEPAEAELRSFHEDNGAAFTRPETKIIDYAILTPDMIAGEISVGEDEVRAWNAGYRRRQSPAFVIRRIIATRPRGAPPRRRWPASQSRSLAALSSDQVDDGPRSSAQAAHYVIISSFPAVTTVS